jgi:hypothetical protein
VRVLLDENFPLGLLRRLHLDGFAAEHIITLGWRGAPDARIRERLQDEQSLFLTRMMISCSVRQSARSSSSRASSNPGDWMIVSTSGGRLCANSPTHPDRNASLR